MVNLKCKRFLELLRICLAPRKKLFAATLAAALVFSLLEFIIPKVLQLYVDAVAGNDLRWFPWGSSPSPNCELAVMVTNGPGCGTDDTWPVGSRPDGRSPVGLLDMAGNVSEWVADWYDATYYDGGPAANPPGPATGTSGVVRGGSLDNGVNKAMRVSHRVEFAPEGVGRSIGFRCVLEAER